MTTPRVPEKARSAVPVWVFALIGCVVLTPVAIAVVGIVAAIAIPNFIMFQCKSKQTEARANLSGLFTAEKVFYGEYGFYTTDLKALNWEPDGSPIYLYGFAEAGPERVPSGAQAPSDYDPSRKDTSDPSALFGRYSVSKMNDSYGIRLDASVLPSGAAVANDGQSFLAAAVAEVDGDSSAFDIWTIDENKSLRAYNNDCAF